MLDMEIYRQLPAKMHLISMRLASCLLTQLTTCLFQLTFRLFVSRSRGSSLLISRLLPLHM